MKEIFKKGKIATSLILTFLVIILFGINNVYAKIITHYSCRSGTYQVSGTKKCCVTFDGVKATSISNNNCQYPQSSVSSSHSHKGGTYNGITCPVIGAYCYGSYPSDMIAKTYYYSTTVYFKNYYGNSIGSLACTSTTCTVNMPGTNACPSGYSFNYWVKESGPITSINGTGVTVTTYDYNTSAYVKPSCTLNKTYYGSTGGSETITSDAQDTNTETNTCAKSGNTTAVVNVNNHKITYNLNGGHFLDGSTSRTEIIKDNIAVGGLSLNPLKDGYKFVSWQDESGKDFDFSSKISEDITLTATYEKLSDDFKDAYSCPDGYTLDPANAKCYKLLNFNSTSNTSLTGIFYVPYNSTADPILGTAYNYTTYTYADGDRMCYGYNAPNDGDPGAIALIKGREASAVGKNNSSYYFQNGSSYVKYEDQDWWKSEDTCNFGSNCTLDACTKVSGSCKVTYSAIIFHSVSATSNLKDSEDIEEVHDVENTNPTDITIDREDINSSSSDITTNPKTGNSLWLIIAFAVFFGGLGFYFHRNYQNIDAEQ